LPKTNYGHQESKLADSLLLLSLISYRGNAEQENVEPQQEIKEHA